MLLNNKIVIKKYIWIIIINSNNILSVLLASWNHIVILYNVYIDYDIYYSTIYYIKT